VRLQVPAELGVADEFALRQIHDRRIVLIPHRLQVVSAGFASPPLALGLPVPLTWLVGEMDDCLPEAPLPTAGLVAVCDGSPSHKYRSAWLRGQPRACGGSLKNQPIFLLFREAGSPKLSCVEWVNQLTEAELSATGCFRQQPSERYSNSLNPYWITVYGLRKKRIVPRKGWFRGTRFLSTERNANPFNARPREIGRRAFSVYAQFPQGFATI